MDRQDTSHYGLHQGYMREIARRVIPTSIPTEGVVKSSELVMKRSGLVLQIPSQLFSFVFSSSNKYLPVALLAPSAYRLSVFCCSAVRLTRWYLTILRLVQRWVLLLMALGLHIPNEAACPVPSLVSFLQTSHLLKNSNSTSSRKCEKCRKLWCMATETQEVTVYSYRNH